MEHENRRGGERNEGRRAVEERRKKDGRIEEGRMGREDNWKKWNGSASIDTFQ